MNAEESGRLRERAAVLAEIGLTPAHAVLFNIVSYGLVVESQDLCERATIEDYAVCGATTVSQAQAALADCFSKGWLRIVDASALQELRTEIRNANLIGPVYGFPNVGGVDFTHAGAEKWRVVCDRLGQRDGRVSHLSYSDVVRIKTAHYFHSESKALAERDLCKTYDAVVAVSEPVAIGPWRANWWRRFPEGYRIDVEERPEEHGRSCDGLPQIYLDPFRPASKKSVDLVLAKGVMRRRGASVAEWCILANCELGRIYRESVIQMASTDAKKLGVRLTPQQCERGLQRCIRKGWLRFVNDHVVAEIEGLLRNDRARIIALFDRRTEIAFSIAGANFYRSLSAEILGSEWEEDLIAEHSYYREEHRYSETPLPFRQQLDDVSFPIEAPKFSRVTSIEPWCVYWWERFPSGYKMELTFGEATT